MDTFAHQLGLLLAFIITFDMIAIALWVSGRKEQLGRMFTRSRKRRHGNRWWAYRFWWFSGVAKTVLFYAYIISIMHRSVP